MQRSELLSLSDYWRIMRRRKAVILASMFIIGGVVFYRNITTPPTYQTSTTVMVEGGKSLATGTPEYYNPWEGDYVDSQTNVIGSAPVAEQAGRYLGWITDSTPPQYADEIIAYIAGSVANAERIRTTNLIAITIESGDPREAAAIANAVAHAYQEWSLQKRNEQAHSVRVFVEQQLIDVGGRLKISEEALRDFKASSDVAGALATMQQQLVSLQTELASLLEEYTEQHPDVIETRAKIDELRAQLAESPELEMKFRQLSRDVETNSSLYQMLRQRFEDARIAEAEKVSDVTIVNPATVPGSPVAPRVKLNTMIGLVVGLLLGLVMAFVKENLDTSIATIEDVEDFLQIPILGVIPYMEAEVTRKRRYSITSFFGILPPPPRLSVKDSRKLLVALGGGTSPPAEAYKTLRTNIQFAVSQKKSKLIAFTSSGPHEGKTITVANCAIAFAQSGQRVLLFSADLRRELVADLFGIRTEPGLAEIISGDIEWRKAVRSIEDLMVGDLDTTKILETPGIDNLSILTAGRVPPNPAEFLQSDRMKEFLKEIREQFDYVFLDCPPVLPVSDALVLAPQVDGIIFVYQSGQTARGALKRAKSMILASGATVLGVVLNAIKAQEMKLAPSYRYYGGYYGGKYGYGYGYEKDKEEGKDKWYNFFKKGRS